MPCSHYGGAARASSFLSVFMIQRSITWGTRLSVRPSDCDLISEIKLFVVFHQIEFKSSLPIFVELARILYKSPQWESHLRKKVRTFLLCFRSFSPILVNLDNANLNIIVLNSREMHGNQYSGSHISLKRVDKFFSLFSIFFIIFGQNIGTGDVHIYFITASCAKVGAVNTILHLGS
jgi:hypothetical protein